MKKYALWWTDENGWSNYSNETPGSDIDVRATQDAIEILDDAKRRAFYDVDKVGLHLCCAASRHLVDSINKYFHR